jgi:site-specific recombinase XerD
MARSKFFGGSLYQQMSDDLHLAGFSQRTHDGYLRAVRQLCDYCHKSPDTITEEGFRRFFLHLKNEKHFAYGSLRVAFSGIKFFYTRTCRRDWRTLATMKLQNVKSLPEVITIPQVHQIIDACRGSRCTSGRSTRWGCGWRKGSVAPT